MEIRSDIASEVWNCFVVAHPQGHVLQTAAWASLKEAFGWQSQVVGLLDSTVPASYTDEWCWAMQLQPILDAEIVAGAQILYRELPGKLGQMAYVPRGPLVDWHNSLMVARMMEALQQSARAHGATVVTIEPDLLDLPENRERLAAHGLHPSPLDSVQPRRTLVVDISGDEESILAAIKSKTRYNVRLAARRGVRVRPGGEADLPAFYRLMEVTAGRDRFAVHEPAYYERAYRLFAPRDWTRLLLAEVDGQVVAGLMVFALGRRAWYFYGASSDQHREKMPTYLLQWEAMRWARSLGCTEYDLWGIPDEDEEQLEDGFTERQDGLWGVYRFKRGFGGQVLRTVGAWDLPLRPLRYQLFNLAARLRRGTLV